MVGQCVPFAVVVLESLSLCIWLRYIGSRLYVEILEENVEKIFVLYHTHICDH